MLEKEYNLELISSKNIREIDPYQLVAKFENKYWSIQDMNFNSYKIVIQNGATKLEKHFNEVELVEHFD